MSGYNSSYNEYLGKLRCCDLNKEGPRGPEGPTGPAGIGPVGPSGISTTINSATYNSGTSTLTLPNQYSPIAYYSITLPSAGDTISTINFGTFPSGYQAIVFVDGQNGTGGSPCVIASTITNVLTNLSANMSLESTGGQLGYATLIIYNTGSNNLCNITGYYN